MTVRIINADVLEGLKSLPDESVHCVVTSPPYWGLRDYGHAGQIGLEKTPQEFVARMVEVFREVRRVLRKDGTCFVNLGDSYAGVSAKEAITEEPWDYVEPLEFIDVIPFEDVERELNRKRFRILEAPNADR